MILTKEIIRKLIKEEVQKQISSSDIEDKANALFTQLTSLSKNDATKVANELRTMVTKMKDKEPAEGSETEGSLEVSEGHCGQMQAIDMGVDHNKDDHEGNMAKRQMFKTAQYAAEIFDNIQDDDKFPSWIQSKMTKIADYIGAVKHYLEYDKVIDGHPANRKEKKWSDADHDKQEDLAKKLAKKNPDMPKDKKMAIAGAQVNRDKRKRSKK